MKTFIFTTFFVSFITFFTTSFAKNYILTPKDESGFALASEHNLEPLANFGDLIFYTTTDKNLNRYHSTLTEYFDIEEDKPVSIFSSNVKSNFNKYFKIQKSEAPWHLDRVTKRQLPLDGSFPLSTKGSCHTRDELLINTYIVDTGIDTEHPEFEGRAVWGANFADNKDTDCNNHGTHVAGLVGSKSYGVCVDANLYAVKVLDCGGSGSTSGVIQGIQWAFKHHRETSSKTKALSGKLAKGIINMSLGGGYSDAINRAVDYCVENDENFYIVVAAGNENNDACRTSPASSSKVLTVMASDKSDNRAWFSNWGSCADVYAPGVDVLSTIPDGKTAKYSGTSMASPVMAGVLNHYVDKFPNKNMDKLKKKVLSKSSKGVISTEKPNTPNLLAYLKH